METTISNAAMCHSRAAWLLPPRRLSGALAASQGAGPWQQALERHGDGVRGIASSFRVQHEAQATAQQGAAVAAQPQEQRQERTCWQCGTRLSAHVLFFCPECKSVQPAAPEADYFPVFGM